MSKGGYPSGRGKRTYTKEAATYVLLFVCLFVLSLTTSLAKTRRYCWTPSARFRCADAVQQYRLGAVRSLSSTFHADTCNVDESTPFHFRQLKVRRGLCKSSSRPRNKDVAYTWWGQCCQSVYGSVRERGKARERGHGIPNDWEHVCSNIYPTPLLIIYTISFYNIQRRHHCLLVF